MSLAPTSELEPEALQAAFGRWFQASIGAVERIGGGRNSQVYKVTEAAGARSPGRRFALKVYFRHRADERDRLSTEYHSFTYLWANGFRQIPRPLALDSGLGWGVYEFIEGTRIAAGEASEGEVLAAAEFLGRLRDLSRQPESRRLGLASEANFSAGLIANHVRQRLKRLEECLDGRVGAPRRPAGGPHPTDDAVGAERRPYHALQTFLAREFNPLLEQVAGWSERRLAAAGQSFTEELSWDLRTLSPSDFGFHNALRRTASGARPSPGAATSHPAGALARSRTASLSRLAAPGDGRAPLGPGVIFLDFEYFGWDDPAKMISDFLLHPAMNLSAALKRVFAAEIIGRFADWPGLAARVESVYPLFGLKWCMILLNEFLPEALQRRQFAGVAPAEHAALQMEQLGKARLMLEQIREEYQDFPYHG